MASRVVPTDRFQLCSWPRTCENLSSTSADLASVQTFKLVQSFFQVWTEGTRPLQDMQAAPKEFFSKLRVHEVCLDLLTWSGMDPLVSSLNHFRRIFFQFPSNRRTGNGTKHRLQSTHLLVNHVDQRDGLASAPAAAGRMCEEQTSVLVQAGGSWLTPQTS